MRFLVLVLGVGLAMGCGGGDDEDVLDGFTNPHIVTHAYNESDGDYEDLGPADWSCLNTASSDQGTSVEITLTGTIGDFQTGKDVPDETVEAFDVIDWENPFATATSDENGDYSMTIPTGTKRFGFRMTGEKTMDTFLLNQYLDPGTAEQSLDADSVSLLTANALPAFIGVTRTPDLGIVAGAMRDCQDHEVYGAIATVSSTSGTPTPLDGADTYYFSAGPSNTLPVRWALQPFTNMDGLFMTIELPPTATAYLQVWGYIDGQDPDNDDMTLLAEIPTPVIGENVVTFSLEPLRTE